MLNVILSLIMSVSLLLSVETPKGPSPLTPKASVTVTGPYEGPVCLVVQKDGDAIAGPFCADEGVQLKEGESTIVKFDGLTGRSLGEFDLMAIGFNLQSNKVHITITN